MFFEIIRQIIDSLRTVDAPTLYMIIFTPSWLLVLILAAIIVRKKKKPVFTVLAFIPVINFAVFYLFNYTKGLPMFGITRYGPHLVAALIYCVISAIIARSKRKVLPLILGGIPCIVVSLWTVFYVLAMGSYYHFGNFSHQGYEKSMASLIDELEKNYILRDFKEIDFDGLRQEYIPMAAEAERNNDEAAFAEAVANLCYEFHDGHLSMRINDTDLGDEVAERMNGNDYGFSMIRTDDGKVLAILVDETSEAFRQGIHSGTVITGWDGKDIYDALKDVRCVPSSIYMTAYPIAENEEIVKPIFLAGKGGDTVSVRFIDDSGTTKEITAQSMGSYSDRLWRATYPITGKRCGEFAYAEMLDDHCGYLCVPRESFDDMKDIEAGLKDEYPEVKDLFIERIEGLKSQGMDRLIIDIRDNDGGIDVIYEQLVTLFTDREVISYGGSYNGSEFIKYDSWAWTIPYDGRYKDIPVVVLVNAGCASCGDILAYRLSNCPNVTLMGMTTTWGSAQSMGGQILLGGGHISVRYPIIASLDEDLSVLVDAGKDRISSVVLDEKIPLDEKAVHVLYDMDADYDLMYAKHYMETYGNEDT